MAAWHTTCTLKFLRDDQLCYGCTISCTTPWPAQSAKQVRTHATRQRNAGTAFQTSPGTCMPSGMPSCNTRCMTRSITAGPFEFDQSCRVFRLCKGYKFHLIVSHPPCGDACITSAAGAGLEQHCAGSASANQVSQLTHGTGAKIIMPVETGQDQGAA
jgi:hypothetical protein